MTEELKRLCRIDGISGDEGAVRDYIISRIKDKAEITVDNLGNVIAFVKGKKPAKNKVMISAHTDEVGMIVTYINDDGTLNISPVGGIDPRVVFGRRVTVGRQNITGVIGGTAVHNLSSEDRKKSVPFEKMTVDIGTDSREQTEKLVSLGDSVRFVSDFVRFGDGLIRCKAIDDRAGCAIMLRMIDEGLDYDAYFTFVVQEEIGLRGSTCAAYSVNPDYAIVLESTTAADIPSARGADRVCELGKGAVVSFMDRHTIYDKELYSLAFSLAEENGIPCQTKTRVAGGNDAGAIHTSRGGVRTCAVSLPCRYLHSPSCVIKESDFENAYVLTRLLFDRICNK
jgi:endoglucanase